MASGTDLFLGLFNNLAIFIILVAVYGAANSYFEKSTPFRRQTVVGFIFGLFAISCMYVKIHVAEGVIVDQRNTIVALSGAFGGPLSALLCAAMAGAFRTYLGGAGTLAGVIGVCLAAVAGVGLFKLRKQIDSFLKATLGALSATIIILPGFLFVGDINAGWNLLKAMALPYGFAIFLGIFLVGLLLAHEENRYQAVAAQRKSEKRYRELFENLIDISYQTDSEGNFIVISPSSEKVFGYRPVEVIGRQVENFYRHSSRHDDFVAQIQRDGQVQNFEAEIRKKDGSFVWVSTNAKLMKNHEGNFVGIDGVTRDISQIKRSEHEKSQLEKHLRQSQKMEALGTLAGGIAHDFNNILSGMLGYTELALNDVQGMPSIKKKLDMVIRAGGRATDLVKQILSFSRSQKSILKPVSPLAVVQDVLKLIRSSIPTNIEIKQSLNTESYVLADATNIHQVLMNLCTNAAGAMRQSGGVISVILQETTLSQQDLTHHNDVIPGDFLKITVEDTGVGMSKDVKLRAFDPFFTTKDLGEGTGMGLSIVHGIVAELGGFVSLYSEPGKGTAVQVFIPLITEPAEVGRSTAIEPIKDGTERILFVDDEHVQTELAKDALSQYGYQVTTFSDSVTALVHFQQNPDEYDLIITDMTMPKMTGDILTQKIHLKRPEIPVIMCTGFSENINKKKADALDIKAFLYKPIVIANLLRTIRKVLDQDEQRQADDMNRL